MPYNPHNAYDAELLMPPPLDPDNIEDIPTSNNNNRSGSVSTVSTWREGFIEPIQNTQRKHHQRQESADLIEESAYSSQISQLESRVTALNYRKRQRQRAQVLAIEIKELEEEELLEQQLLSFM